MKVHLPESQYWRSLPLEKLRLKLEAERQRALDGSYSYDLPRHRAMEQVYRERVASEGVEVKELETVS